MYFKSTQKTKKKNKINVVLPSKLGLKYQYQLHSQGGRELVLMNWH